MALLEPIAGAQAASEKTRLNTYWHLKNIKTNTSQEIIEA